MPTDSEAAFCDSGWADEYDCVPLRLRLEMLRARVWKPDNVNEECTPTEPEIISVDRNKDGNLIAEDKMMLQAEHCSGADVLQKTSKLPSHQASTSRPTFVSMDINAAGHSVCSPGDFDQNWGSMESHICSTEMPSSEARADVVGNQLLKIEARAVSFPTSLDVPGDVKIPLHDSLSVPDSGHGHDGEVKHEILYEFDDHLDNVVLGDRRRMLISRKLKQSSGSDIGGNSERLSNSSKVVLQSAQVVIEMQKSGSVVDLLICENINHGVNGVHKGSRNDIDKTCRAIKTSSPPALDNQFDAASIELKASCASVESKSFGRQETTMTNAYTMASSSSLLAQVKTEPVDMIDSCSEGKEDTGEILPVKSEPEFSEFPWDELDHLPLIDRVKLLSSGTSSLAEFPSAEFLNKNVGLALDVGTDVLESVKPINISQPRKRRKTATNSVETALEEDAPELLKVLIEKGITLQEIRLYGQEESEDALDESLCEDSFAELEAVISKLFSQRQSFLKFPLLRFTKGEKANYCLSCLLSLVEQARFLQHRKWSVEWGWCRDLQSFIFVFPRHNRIVLERPEYGFATYFFELLNSISVHWQIKRLVTAMKLTNCGRITVIENKPLVVGEDLSEGEARVLAEYGWTPNTGLGTMLNYCDRVVHDRKQEINSLEWRSKIAKQLMNGYNGGTIVSKDLPRKFAEDEGLQRVQVKLEE